MWKMWLHRQGDGRNHLSNPYVCKSKFVPVPSQLAQMLLPQFPAYRDSFPSSPSWKSRLFWTRFIGQPPNLKSHTGTQMWLLAGFASWVDSVWGRVGCTGEISHLDVDILWQANESSAYSAVRFALIAKDWAQGCFLRFLSLASLLEKWNLPLKVKRQSPLLFPILSCVLHCFTHPDSSYVLERKISLPSW